MKYWEKQLIDAALQIRDAQADNIIAQLRGEIKLKDLHIKHLQERLDFYVQRERQQNIRIITGN